MSTFIKLSLCSVALFATTGIMAQSNEQIMYNPKEPLPQPQKMEQKSSGESTIVKDESVKVNDKSRLSKIFIDNIVPSDFPKNDSGRMTPGEFEKAVLDWKIKNAHKIKEEYRIKVSVKE